MNTLKKDLESPINEVDRVWLRVGMLIAIQFIMFPSFIIAGIFHGLFEGAKGWWQCVNDIAKGRR